MVRDIESQKRKPRVGQIVPLYSKSSWDFQGYLKLKRSINLLFFDRANTSKITHSVPALVE
jgi:hypothetical protein